MNATRRDLPVAILGLLLIAAIMLMSIFAEGCSAAPMGDPEWSGSVAVSDGEVLEVQIDGGFDLSGVAGVDLLVRVAAAAGDLIEAAVEMQFELFGALKVATALSCLDGFCSLCVRISGATWCGPPWPIELMQEGR